MAENKKSFVVYTSWKTFLDDLNSEQLGNWFKWVMDYCNDANPEYPQDQATRLACKMTQDVLKRDLKKYEAKVKSINHINEERKRKRQERNRNEIVTKSLENKNEIVGVNVNDNVNVNVNDNVLSKDNNNRDINISCSKQASNDYNFEKFWKEYPRKKGKDKCLRWFKTHRPKPELVNQMIKAIQEQKNSMQWRDPQYIPHPYTWLNGGRWNDEIDSYEYSNEYVHNDDNGGFDSL